MDGINFSEHHEGPDIAGWLECAACGDVGPFAYVQQDALIGVVERMNEKWPLNANDPH